MPLADFCEKDVLCSKNGQATNGHPKWKIGNRAKKFTNSKTRLTQNGRQNGILLKKGAKLIDFHKNWMPLGKKRKRNVQMENQCAITQLLEKLVARYGARMAKKK